MADRAVVYWLWDGMRAAGGGVKAGVEDAVRVR